MSEDTSTTGANEVLKQDRRGRVRVPRERRDVPGLLAQIVVAKYCDHLPLYRQESIYWTRHQVWLPRQTMAEWMGLAADWLKPIYEHIRSEVLSGG